MKAGLLQGMWGGMLLALTIVAVNAAEDRALGLAIQSNNLAKVKEILAADPQQLNKQIPYNSFPLFMAIEKLNVAMVKFLIEQGAKVNVVDDKGETALTKLVLVNPDNPARFGAIKELFQMFIAQNANIKQQNRQGETALYILASRRMGKSTQPLKLEFMKLLIDHGARPRGQDKAEKPLLHNVMEHMTKDENSTCNVVETITFLVENGADVDAVNKDGNTALSRIVATDVLSDEDKVKLIGVLVGHGANIRKKNKAKKAPLDLVDKGTPVYEALRKKPSRK